MPQHLHFVLQAARGARMLAFGHPYGQILRGGGVRRGALQVGPGVGAHEPGARVAIHQGLADLVEIRGRNVEQGAAVRLAQLELAQVFQADMAAGDGQVGWMQQEVARARLRHEAVAAHGLGREGRLCRLAVGRGRQGQGVRQPRFVRQQAVGIVKNFQSASGGARQQRRQRGRLQDLDRSAASSAVGKAKGRTRVS